MREGQITFFHLDYDLKGDSLPADLRNAFRVTQPFPVVTVAAELFPVLDMINAQDRVHAPGDGPLIGRLSVDGTDMHFRFDIPFSRSVAGFASHSFPDQGFYAPAPGVMAFQA
jgi:hypothetical protein